MPISSMCRSVLMHEPVTCCVLLCESPCFCGSHNPPTAQWCVMSYALSQDFCWDPPNLHFGRHGVGAGDLHIEVPILVYCTVLFYTCDRYQEIQLCLQRKPDFPMKQILLTEMYIQSKAWCTQWPSREDKALQHKK